MADWLVRTATPAWLDAAGLADQATALRAVEALTGRPSADSAGAVLNGVAAELAEHVPAAVPSAARPVVAAQLARARASAGERAASAAMTHDLAEEVTEAAAGGVSRAMADLVLRRQRETGLGLWARAFSEARKAVDGSGRSSAGRRPSAPRSGGTNGARRVAMRAVRMAAGPAAIPLTILEAGVRSARERRARDRLDQAAARAALAACCRQLIDDAAWIVAGAAAARRPGEATSAVADALEPIAGVQQRSLFDVLERLAADPASGDDGSPERSP